MTVLIIEDNEDNRRLASKRLRAAGHQTLLAPTAAEGLEAIRTQQPDIVLLDLQLPDMNGLDVVAQLRADRHDVASAQRLHEQSIDLLESRTR